MIANLNRSLMANERLINFQKKKENEIKIVQNLFMTKKSSIINKKDIKKKLNDSLFRI